MTGSGDVAVLVSNAGSGELRVLRLDGASGVLTTVQTLAVGGMVMPLALSPDRRFFYAARRSDPFEVLSFGVNAATGELTPLGAAPLPHSMAYLATDRAGRFLFSASYGGHQIAVSSIGVDGVAGPAHQVIATPPKAHAIQGDPSNRFVFATSLGGDVVLQFHFDAASGRLTPNAVPAFHARVGSGPRHFVFSADARFVYLLCELDATLDVLAFDADAGTLSHVQTVPTLPPGFSGAPWAADLHLTPDGRFLYSSERRSSTLAAFAVDPSDGTLTSLGHHACEAQPRGFSITPDGRFLVVAGQLSNRLGVFSIDATCGSLLSVGGHAVGLDPNWVETFALMP